MAASKFFKVTDAVTGTTQFVFAKGAVRAEKFVTKDRFSTSVATPAEVRDWVNANPGQNIPSADEVPAASEPASPAANPVDEPAPEQAAAAAEASASA